MGSNHMILMTVGGTLYGIGSNQFGQLGIENQNLKDAYDHPLTLQKLYYTQSPIEISYLNSLGSDTMTQIACGDNFSMGLT